MKGRESGMPDENYWDSFFDADCITTKLDCVKTKTESVVEFGSGYGTFTLPLARKTLGTIYALDIEDDLISQLKRKAFDNGLSNINVRSRDFISEGTGLPDKAVDHAMIYNILHIENPISLLKEAFRVLKPNGSISIIHWKHDSSTPRGPSLDIRPRPEQCRAWAEEAGFEFLRDQDLSVCCKYHYGMLLTRPHSE